MTEGARKHPYCYWLLSVVAECQDYPALHLTRNLELIDKCFHAPHKLALTGKIRDRQDVKKLQDLITLSLKFFWI